MRLWTAEEARDHLWQNYQDNFTAAEQPLRIALLDEGDDWWRFQVRFPDKVRIVDVGPRGAIYGKVTLPMDQIAEIR